MEHETAWKKYDEADLEALEQLSAEYIDFISENKTERECATTAVRLAEEHGYVAPVSYTHLARPATYILCPGAVFRPRGNFPRCIAKLQLSNGRVESARIESLDGTIVLEAGE